MHRVIYASRTHKQLSQSMKEMKRTAYAECLVAVCLASREQYCTNTSVRRGQSLGEINHLCREMHAKSAEDSRCSYYRSPAQGTNIGDYTDVVHSLMALHLEEMPKADELGQGRPMVRQRGAVMDIEDLMSAGLKKHGCPYYAARFAAKTTDEVVSADVIFCPYNYVSSTSGLLPLKGAVVIFDEGHNIEKTCEESASGAISTFTLKQCITVLTKVIAIRETPSLGLHMKDFEQLMDGSVSCVSDFAEVLCNDIEQMAMPELKKKGNSWSNPEICRPPVSWFTSVMLKSRRFDEPQSGHHEQSDLADRVAVAAVDESASDADANKTSVSGLLSLIQKQLRDFMAVSDFRFHSQDGTRDMSKMFMSALEALSDFMELAFPVPASAGHAAYKKFMVDSYRVTISKLDPQAEQDEKMLPKKGPSGFQLDLLCLNPGVAIGRLTREGVRSIIITSGTLAPMNSFESELGIEFKHKLSNPHVIKRDQLMIFPIAKHADVLLDGSYKNTMDDARRSLPHPYYHSLGLAVCEYVKQIPKGVLIFFKSYIGLSKSLDSWKKSGLWQEIESEKRIFEEPRNKRWFEAVLNEYKRTVDDGRGAILVAVYRGKISEGLDLSDDYCRGVMVIGLPFPNWTDSHVQLKREFLKNKRDSRLSPDQWYNSEMLRAVNQAIGRVVRHRNDYGIVLLIDSNYNWHLKGLSLWLQNFVRAPDQFHRQKFTAFFKLNKSRAVAAAGEAVAAVVPPAAAKRSSSDCAAEDEVLVVDSVAGPSRVIVSRRVTAQGAQGNQLQSFETAWSTLGPVAPLPSSTAAGAAVPVKRPRGAGDAPDSE